jgi:hypothetical protein
MSDNVVLNLGSGGASVRAKNIAGVDTQIIQLDFGGESAESLVSNTNPLPSGIYDASGNAINSLAAGTGQNGLMVAMGATNFFYSVVNTTSTQLAAGASFVGGVETALNEPSASILLTTDQPVIFTINQYEDAGGTQLVSTWSWNIAANNSFSRSFVINGNYLNFVVINVGQQATTKFNLNVAYGAIPSATNLGNTPVSLNEINGIQIPTGGSLPVNVIGSTLVGDPATIAAQSSDSPLFLAQTGDPSGDWANVDMFDAMFNPSTGLSQAVNVVNPVPTDVNSVNNGTLEADSKTYYLSSGQSILIDTTGYDSLSIQSIAGIITVTQGNTQNALISFSNVLNNTTGATLNTVATGVVGTMPTTCRWVKLAMAVGATNYGVAVLRSAPPTINSLGGFGINLSTIAGNSVVNGGITGSLGVGGNVAENTVAGGFPVMVGGVARTTALIAQSNGAIVRHTMSSGGALVTWPYAVPDVSWQATSGLTPLATTASTALVAAGAAGIRNYCTAIQIQNTSTSIQPVVTILDGTTVIWAACLGEGSATSDPMITIVFPTPLKGTAATAMNIQSSSAVATVYYNAQGFQAP